MKKLVVSTLALCLSMAVVSASNVKEYKQGDVWVRTVIHDDGSRTVSMKDEKVKEIIKRTYAAPREGVDGDLLVCESRFEINAKGDYVRGQVKDRQGNLTFVSEFMYDDFDRLLEERITDARGVPVRRLIYKYDQFGKARPFAISFENGRATSGPQAVQNADDYSTGRDQGFRLNPQAAAQRQAAEEAEKDDERRRFRLFRGRDSEESSDSSSDSGTRRRGLFRRR